MIYAVKMNTLKLFALVSYIFLVARVNKNIVHRRERERNLIQIKTEKKTKIIKTCTKFYGEFDNLSNISFFYEMMKWIIKN